MPSPNLPNGFDFTDPDIYAERLSVREFAELRRAAPVWWNDQPPDVHRAALSGRRRRGADRIGALSMINMDEPEHTRMRKIVSRAFTPRAVERLRAELGERAQRIAEQARTVRLR
jgi:cholest-4-en-3-one 26-monooxygenase